MLNEVQTPAIRPHKKGGFGLYLLTYRDGSLYCAALIGRYDTEAECVGAWEAYS